MTARYRFHVQSPDARRVPPHRVIIAQEDPDTTAVVVLRILAYLLFHRERIRIQARLHDDNIPFLPDVVQLDYELRPALWIECGECPAARLDRLAVKVPSAELWVLQSSVERAENLLRAMQKAGLRRNRYGVIGLETALVDELTALLKPRNDILWVRGSLEPPQLQFDFNGLWFDTTFVLTRF